MTRPTRHREPRPARISRALLAGALALTALPALAAGDLPSPPSGGTAAPAAHIKLENFTAWGSFPGFSNEDLQTTILRRAPAPLADLLREGHYAVLVKDAHFHVIDGNYCIASVGLVAAEDDGSDAHPRIPSHRFTGVSRSAELQPLTGDRQRDCLEQALTGALLKLAATPLIELTAYADHDAVGNGPPLAWNLWPANPSKVNVALYGDDDVSAKGYAGMRQAAADRGFGTVFDYRTIALVGEAVSFAIEGRVVCMVQVGVASPTGNDRTHRTPMHTNYSFAMVSAARGQADCIEIAADNATQRFLGGRWNEAGILRDFEFAAEGDVPLPKAAPVSYRNGLVPAHNAFLPYHVATCTNACVDGACVRTYADGTQENWQAMWTYSVEAGAESWDISGGGCGAES